MHRSSDTRLTEEDGKKNMQQAPPAGTVDRFIRPEEVPLPGDDDDWDDLFSEAEEAGTAYPPPPPSDVTFDELMNSLLEACHEQLTPPPRNPAQSEPTYLYPAQREEVQNLVPLRVLAEIPLPADLPAPLTENALGEELSNLLMPLSSTAMVKDVSGLVPLSVLADNPLPDEDGIELGCPEEVALPPFLPPAEAPLSSPPEKRYLDLSHVRFPSLEEDMDVKPGGPLRHRKKHKKGPYTKNDRREKNRPKFMNTTSPSLGEGMKLDPANKMAARPQAPETMGAAVHMSKKRKANQPDPGNSSSSKHHRLDTHIAGQQNNPVMKKKSPPKRKNRRPHKQNARIPSQADLKLNPANMMPWTVPAELHHHKPEGPPRGVLNNRRKYPKKTNKGFPSVGDEQCKDSQPLRLQTTKSRRHQGGSKQNQDLKRSCFLSLSTLPSEMGKRIQHNLKVRINNDEVLTSAFERLCLCD